MKTSHDDQVIDIDKGFLALAEHGNAARMLPAVLAPDASRQLLRMFRDPRVLEPHERHNLIAQLRTAVERAPQVAEVRVLLGMALSVDLQAQEALEELRIAVEQTPDCFVARLKYGELLMRLRICQKAAEQTHEASLLAVNAAQSELARRQAATIRTMLREGIERGGYAGFLSRIFGRRRSPKEQSSASLFVGAK
jgi:cytochrome c-type biogenesis protein CcmH/NrfG